MDDDLVTLADHLNFNSTRFASIAMQDDIRRRFIHSQTDIACRLRRHLEGGGPFLNKAPNLGKIWQLSS